jgi:hypothetical protein
MWRRSEGRWRNCARAASESAVAIFSLSSNGGRQGDVYVDNSIRYLQNYLATLQDIANGDGNVDRKGKRITMQAPEDRCLGHPQGKKRKKLGGDQNKAGLNATWMQASQLIANVEPGEQ